MQYQLLINGVLVDGEGERQSVYNPATGEVILEIAEASPAQVDAAVLAADSAFAEWGQTTPKARAECLLKLADSIEQNALEFARLESQNCGKPLHCVINDEIPAIVDVFRFSDLKPDTGYRAWFFRQVRLSGQLIALCLRR